MLKIFMFFYNSVFVVLFSENAQATNGVQHSKAA